VDNLPDSLPSWVIVSLLLLNLFRQPLSSLIGAVPTAVQDHFKHRAVRAADSDEFEQSLAENTLGAELQQQAYREMRDHLIDQELVELVNRQMEHILTASAGEARHQAEMLQRVIEEQARQRRAIVRVGDLLGVIYSAVKQKNGELMLHVSGEIDDILGQNTE
jgi:hypothetical protein